MKKRMFPLLAALVLLSLTACGAETAESFAMDTLMKFTAYGDGAADAVLAAQREVNRLETLLSRTREDSEVSRINRSAGSPVAVDPEVYRLLETALEESARTGGAFDVTLAPVSSAWGFTEEAHRVPEQAELEELLAHVGPQHVRLSDQSVTLDPGTQIDLGAIAKGYASDAVAAIFRQHGVASGVAALGGNVYACGARPDGAPWRVAVQDPRDAAAYAGVLSLTESFAVTSGGYQRYFEEDGTTYHHILDPATGRPADSGLLSVTVVAPENGARCDALSTALFVLGEERGLDLWRRDGGSFDLVLVTRDDRVVVTAGLADKFEMEEGSGYVYETVS